MVNWYERITRTAAKHRLMIDFMAPQTHRLGTRVAQPESPEGILGNEIQSAGSAQGDLRRRHKLTLPFT